MKVENVNLHRFRNAGHYQFHTDVMDTIEVYSATALNVADVFDDYKAAHQREGKALVAITKSATTQEIVNADHERDYTLRGFFDQVRSDLNHYDENTRSSAIRVNIILDGYGNMIPKPYDEESGLINGLINDLGAKVPNDLEILNLTPWISTLFNQNTRFIALEASRNSEESDRSELRMKQVRVEVDAAYRKLVERLNALVIIAGEDSYRPIVNKINVRIERAQVAMAQSKAHPVIPTVDL